MKKYNFTMVGLSCSALLLYLNVTFNLDIAERLHELMHATEVFELDELVLALFIVVIFFGLDVAHSVRIAENELEKLRLYRTTISSVQHIMGNFLNSMLLVKIAAEGVNDFPKSAIEAMERDIELARQQIQKLSDLHEINPKSIATAVGSRVND